MHEFREATPREVSLPVRGIRVVTLVVRVDSVCVLDLLLLLREYLALQAIYL